MFNSDLSKTYDLSKSIIIINYNTISTVKYCFFNKLSIIIS